MTNGPAIGMCFDRTYPAAFVLEVAERLERDGADQLWVIEDSFFTAGISLAAAALARTDRLEVGIGILPTVARNPAFVAMEIATLAGLAPGRIIAGFGHGVQSWMGQMGARARSPLTAFDEVVTSVKRLLAGETVTLDGQYVHLDGVALDQPPATVPPVVAGVQGPKSLALAGRVADGVILVEGAGPAHVRDALRICSPDGPFRVTVFSSLCLAADRATAFRDMAPLVQTLLDDADPGIRSHPHYDDLVDRHTDGGLDAIATMPADWWLDIGAIGTLADIQDHIDALADAGVDDVALFPAPELAIGRAQLDDVATIVRSR